MDKIKFYKAENVRVKADNSIDSLKIYDISAKINLLNSTMHAIDNGEVFLDKVKKASFSLYDKNFSISYYGIQKEEMNNICNEVLAFISEANLNIPKTVEI